MRWHTRGAFRFGPYFRQYAVQVTNTRRNRAGWTSQGFHFRSLKLTVNTTRGIWSWDSPGRGAVDGLVPVWVMDLLPLWLTRQPDGREWYTNGRRDRLGR